MAYGERLAAVEGIDRVEGPFSITNPATGKRMTPDEVVQLYSAPEGSLSPPLAAAVAELKATYLRDHTVRLDAISPLRSTAMYRTGFVTSAFTNTVCPDRRFNSPRNPDGPWRMISLPAASTIATSPSRIAMNG